MRPSAEEKERFLQYIRDGDDRATAAWRINPEYTGSMFRSMCSSRSPRSYDADFAAAYDEAVDERGPLDPLRPQIWSGARESRTTTASGLTKAGHLTNDQLEDFLDFVREGVQAWTAAASIDPPTSMTQINRRVTKDADFAREYRQAREEGYPAYQDSLRAEAQRQAFAGDYRALKDQMLMHLEEARALMTSRTEITGPDGAALKLVAEHFPGLPPEMLDEMIRMIEEKEFGSPGPPNQLGPGKHDAADDLVELDDGPGKGE